jgi:hypothetical protein
MWGYRMATGKNVDLPQVDPEAEKRWQLARREDLDSVFGIVVSIPRHGLDELGNWRYGGNPPSGMVKPEVIAEFEAEIRSIIVESASPLVKAGMLSEEQIDEIQSHPYETGPAAQSWPQFFFEVYQQAEPFISGTANFIAIAEFIRQVASGIRSWQYRKRKEVEQAVGDSIDQTGSLDLDPRMVMTLPDLVALCYTDLAQRHGRGGNVVIDAFPRDHYGYATPGHPAGGETYLIRLKSGEFSFFYLVDGRGGVSEHYLLAGDELLLLPLPNLLADEHFSGAYRQPQQSRHLEVRASATMGGADGSSRSEPSTSR